MKIVGALLSAAIVTMALAAPARAAQPSLTVSVFQGMQNLPLFAAQQKGFFAEHGLSVDLEITPSSDEQRAGLADGKYQIIHCGVDNGVAMADVAKVDVAAVIGGDSGFNRLVVQPDIHAITDLRGKTVIVDAPDTAYAFQLYEILKRSGLNKGDYNVKPVGATSRRLVDIQQNKDDKASILNPPFAFTAENDGLKDQGSAVSIIGPYQATAGIVLRSWAKQHPDTLVAYLQAYIEGLRYALDPKNKDEAIKMLADGLKLPPDVAAATYAVAADPVVGLAKDAHFDGPGFDNVLRLRADWTGRAPGPAATYVDLSYYEKALAGLR
jgi:ABC-type nitrate/sulfonate/bicarbonate transport system substrate-binding protein